MQASIPPVQGVTCATLFVGMWRTCFSWHTEDYDLSALNMLHMGAAKHWYRLLPASCVRSAKRAPEPRTLTPQTPNPQPQIRNRATRTCQVWGARLV